MSDQEPKPKIIVDDNWKERVQAEKEALRQQASEKSSDSGTLPKSSEDVDRDEPIPPASPTPYTPNLDQHTAPHPAQSLPQLPITPFSLSVHRLNAANATPTIVREFVPLVSLTF